MLISNIFGELRQRRASASNAHELPRIPRTDRITRSTERGERDSCGRVHNVYAIINVNLKKRKQDKIINF